jgi:hypothetical protein
MPLISRPTQPVRRNPYDAVLALNGVEIGAKRLSLCDNSQRSWLFLNVVDATLTDCVNKFRKKVFWKVRLTSVATAIVATTACSRAT